MLDGLVSKVSEAVVALTTTIQQTADIMRVTSTASTTQFATLIPAFGNFQGSVCFFQNKSGGSIVALTTGNIAGSGSITILNLRQAVFVFSVIEGKWYVTQDT